MARSFFTGRRGATIVDAAVLVALTGITFALIAPAVVTAREKSNRVLCTGNLQRQAKALEQYCADYGGWFPGWPGMGSHEPKVRLAHIVAALTDPAGGQTVLVSPGNVTPDMLGRYFPRMAAGGIGRYRSIGVAYAPDRNFSEWRPGRFNMGPIKMGLTVSLGYLGDLSSMYCPSGREMNIVAFSKGGDRDYATRELDGIADMEKTGGLNAKSFTHGDYTWLARGNDRLMDGWLGATVSSHYNYRPTPFLVPEQLDDRLCAVPYTVPKVKGLNGEAMFKTQKLLGGRALLCDTFDKCFDATPEEIQFAAGTQMHRDGYNVTYGDGHAGWYEDEKSVIASWPPPGQAPCEEAIRHLYSSCSDRADIYAPDSLYKNPGGNSFLVWHMFDQAAGIDAAEPQPAPSPAQ